MTFRVDRLIEADLPVLRVSGRITAEDLQILRHAVEGEGGTIAIDLEAVGLIDADAVRFLATVEATGGALLNCPAYIREWVNQQRTRETPDESEA